MNKPTLAALAALLLLAAPVTHACSSPQYQEAMWEFYGSETEFGPDTYLSKYKGTPGFDEKAQYLFTRNVSYLRSGKVMIEGNDSHDELIMSRSSEKEKKYAYRIRPGGCEQVRLPSEDFPFASFAEYDKFRFDHVLQLWRIKAREVMGELRDATGEKAGRLKTRLNKMNRLMNTLRVCDESSKKGENEAVMREIQKVDAAAGIR